MIVKILQSHIDKGKMKDAHFCPVALAIKNTNKNIIYVWACYGAINIKLENGKIYEFSTPKKVQDFMDKFDTWKKVKPFNFLISHGKSVAH
jgi:hypothetical protein